MLTVQDLITAARQAQGVPSNYALAKLLDVREKDLSRWWNGHHVPAPAVVVRLAQLAQLDPAAVLPSIEALRSSHDADTRAMWARAAELAERGAAVAVCAGLALALQSPAPGAAPMVDQAGGGVLDALTVYTLLRILGRLIAPAQRGVKLRLAVP
jgi:hypothetical protein